MQNNSDLVKISILVDPNEVCDFPSFYCNMINLVADVAVLSLVFSSPT